MTDLKDGSTAKIAKWFCITVAIGFITIGVTESLDIKYKSEAVASASESFSKIIIACIESGQDDCDEKYDLSIKAY